jgi:hypothetical protein
MLIGLGLAYLPNSAFGECVAIDPRRAKEHATTAFEGTVRELYSSGIGNELVATLEVHRVWKGKVGRQMTVYFVRSIDGPEFDTDGRFIVFTYAQTSELRKSAGVPSESPHRSNWVPSCEGVAEATEATVKLLGRSRVPAS